MARVARVLRAFRRDDDELTGEWPIQGLGLRDLQRMFGATDEMFDSWPVRPEHVEALQHATGQVLNLDRFDYFVDADDVSP